MVTEKVGSAPQATEIAMAFVKKHRFLLRPLSAVRENGNWLVKIDVGPLLKEVATVKIDARTGDILEYDIP